MPLPRLPRVEVALGMPLDQLTLERLQQLITSAAVPEDFDLDFKEELYGPKDDDKKELAKDLSAMANTLGGVILLGVKEENGVGVAVSEVTFSETEELRMRQVLASLVAPPLPGVEIKRLERADDRSRGVYALAVPKSTQAPHAVRIGDSLRYHQRDGAKSRPLSENEVANLYRSRFHEAASQVARLDTVFAEGTAALADERGLYLALALVPNVPGAMAITRTTEEDLLSWANELGRAAYGRRNFATWTRSMTGLRRVSLDTEAGNNQRVTGRVADLHADGAGSYCEDIVWHTSTPPFWKMTAWSAVTSFHDQLRLLAEHAAAHCGVQGDGVLMANFILKGEGDGLWVFRNNEMVPRPPRRVVRTFAPSRHTVNIDELATSANVRIATARLMLTDLVQQTGLAEVDGVSAQGHILRRTFGVPAEDSDLDRWASQNAVTVE